MSELIKVDVSALGGALLRIEVSAYAFGQLFASMDSEEQAQVLKSMVDHMKPHQIQWDYIAIELEKPEFEGVAKAIVEALKPDA